LDSKVNVIVYRELSERGAGGKDGLLKFRFAKENKTHFLSAKRSLSRLSRGPALFRQINKPSFGSTSKSDSLLG
jgi:hypothetical protein